MTGRPPAVRRKVTPRQREVFSFVKQTITARGYPPSVREVGDEIGVGASVAAQHLQALCLKGYLEREAGVGRGIRVLQEPPPIE